MKLELQTKYLPLGIYTIHIGKYLLGGTCVELKDSKNNVAMRVSVFLENETELLNNHQFFLKDYSENEGIFKALMDAKVITCINNFSYSDTEFVSFYCCSFVDFNTLLKDNPQYE